MPWDMLLCLLLFVMPLLVLICLRRYRALAFWPKLFGAIGALTAGFLLVLAVVAWLYAHSEDPRERSSWEDAQWKHLNVRNSTASGYRIVLQYRAACFNKLLTNSVQISDRTKYYSHASIRLPVAIEDSIANPDNFRMCLYDTSYALLKIYNGQDVLRWACLRDTAGCAYPAKKIFYDIDLKDAH